MGKYSASSHTDQRTSKLKKKSRKLTENPKHMRQLLHYTDNKTFEISCKYYNAENKYFATEQEVAQEK